MIYYKRTDNVCEKCMIEFTYKPLYSDETITKSIPIMEIYEDYKVGMCRITKTNDGFVGR